MCSNKFPRLGAQNSWFSATPGCLEENNFLLNQGWTLWFLEKYHKYLSAFQFLPGKSIDYQLVPTKYVWAVSSTFLFPTPGTLYSKAELWLTKLLNHCRWLILLISICHLSLFWTKLDSDAYFFLQRNKSFYVLHLCFLLRLIPPLSIDYLSIGQKPTSTGNSLQILYRNFRRAVNPWMPYYLHSNALVLQWLYQVMPTYTRLS